MTVISFPIPPYSNVPIDPQNYQPSRFPITNISYGVTTTVTLANGTNNVAPNYVVGQLVRLNIPEPFGANQLNQQVGYVLSLPSASQIVIGINSTGADAFIPSPTFVGRIQRNIPQVVAVGDINSGPVNTSNKNNQTFISGSFINVSP